MSERTGENERNPKGKGAKQVTETESRPVQDGIADKEHLDFCTHCQSTGDLSEMVICSGCSVRRHNNEECNDGNCGTLGCEGELIRAIDWLNWQLGKERERIAELTSQINELSDVKKASLEQNKSKVREMLVNTLTSPLAVTLGLLAGVAAIAFANHKIINFLDWGSNTDEKVLLNLAFIALEVSAYFAIQIDRSDRSGGGGGL